jgi:hypothetical protein
MRVLVTGSRDWTDEAAVVKALDVAFDEAFIGDGITAFTVVHGACPTGADQMASEWVQAMNDGELGVTVSEERHPADWSQGRKAGPERNLRMVQTGPSSARAPRLAASALTATTRRMGPPAAPTSPPPLASQRADGPPPTPPELSRRPQLGKARASRESKQTGAPPDTTPAALPRN